VGIIMRPYLGSDGVEGVLYRSGIQASALAASGAPMMSADDVLNQMARGYCSGVCRRHPVFVSIGIRKCIENLIDRELQLRTRLFERLVGL
jgi:hypothetical protein